VKKKKKRLWHDFIYMMIYHKHLHDIAARRSGNGNNKTGKKRKR